MPKQFDQHISNMKSALSLGYQFLQSRDPDKVAAARSLAAAYKAAADDFHALDLLEQLKAWIGNAADTKDIAYLKALHQAAKQSNADSWRAKAYSARVLRFSGRFWTAQKRFTRALALIGDINAQPEADRPDMADVCADYAEFRAFLGYPKEADGILARIPGPYVKGWHQWVRAIAYHHWAYEAAQPFGQPNPTSGAGPEQKYHDSNNYLDWAQADSNLPPMERVDSELVRAANWGAIWRRRLTHGGDVGEAQRNAAAAIAAFRGPGSDPVNAGWSWMKERRGRLPAIYIPKIDGKMDPAQVAAWRTKFRNHYRSNLEQAGIGDQSPFPSDPLKKDGDHDTEDDHSGDDDGN